MVWFLRLAFVVGLLWGGVDLLEIAAESGSTGGELPEHSACVDPEGGSRCGDNQ